MIERMMKVVLLSQSGRKKEMLTSLRDEGVMHISDRVLTSPDALRIGKEIADMERVKMALGERKAGRTEIEKTEDFSAKHEHLLSILNEEDSLNNEIISLTLEKERIEGFGNFDPELLMGVIAEVPMKIYLIDKKEAEKLSPIRERYIPLSYTGKFKAVALLDPIPQDIIATEFRIPELSLEEVENLISEKKERIGMIEEELSNSKYLIPIYKNKIVAVNDDLFFETANATVEGDDIIYISGYIPEDRVGGFKEYAGKNSLAYMIDEPKEEDNPPTLLKYRGVFRIIDPIFKLLGTVPGYRETDVSSYFLIFFTIFFAMIVGDAGYGLIFLLFGLLMQLKSKKLSDMNILVYVLGGATVIWGAITGNWFGSEAIISHVGFLRRLVIPRISNFPELFGVTSSYAQNGQMKLCFTLGVTQLVLARVINIVNKARSKDLSLFGDLGWLIDSAVLYFLALSLVIGESCSVKAVAICVACGFVLVCVFGSQSPGVPFSKGLKSGLAGFFTTFLDTISCFSNLMSYIRLFAVGMASLAIAQSFNSMGGGIIGGILSLLGVIIIVFGHVLNIIMAILSVLVHDVRLNLLEFSGSVGVEWSGYGYEPFTVKAKEMINE